MSCLSCEWMHKYQGGQFSKKSIIGHPTTRPQCVPKIEDTMKSKLVIVMVGLPARGKSYVAKKLSRYLNWLEYKTEIFNVGERRRRLLSSALSDRDDAYPSQHRAAFFDPNDASAQAIRHHVAMKTLGELVAYLLRDEGSVGIFDATNSTAERRASIYHFLRAAAGPSLPIVFIESQCFDEKILEANMQLKTSGPDYKGQNLADALQDFKGRVDMYAQKYTPLGPSEEQVGYSFCQMIDVGRKFILHNIHGSLASRAVQYLQHFHLTTRQIWLVVNDEDVHPYVKRESDSTRNNDFPAHLVTFINEQRASLPATEFFGSKLRPNYALKQPEPDFHVWASTSVTNVEATTCFQAYSYNIGHLKMLNEPDEDADEGYTDVVDRLSSIVLEIERLSDDVLLILGSEVASMLLGYFRGLSREKMQGMPAKQHGLFKIEPRPYGVNYEEFEWCPDQATFLPRKV